MYGKSQSEVLYWVVLQLFTGILQPIEMTTTRLEGPLSPQPTLLWSLTCIYVFNVQMIKGKPGYTLEQRSYFIV